MQEQTRCEYLAQRVRFDNTTGKLFWLPKGGNGRDEKAFNTRYANKEINSKSNKGYIHICFSFEGATHYQIGHRLIWFIIEGRLPTGVIDHIDGDKVNNSPDNLRDVSYSVNLRNSKRRSDNSSGITGIHFSKKCGKWIAQASLKDGARVHIGSFTDVCEATSALHKFREVHGYTERHGE